MVNLKPGRADVSALYWMLFMRWMVSHANVLSYITRLNTKPVIDFKLTFKLMDSPGGI